MPATKIRAFSNCDTATVVWRTDASIANCVGFALERQVDGARATSFVNTWVGFKGETHKDGDEQPSTFWPIQRFIWSDFEAKPGETLRYRVTPMLGPVDPANRKPGDLEKSAQGQSDWSDAVTVATGKTPGFEAWFNRGIVPAQWLARQNPNKKSLQSNLQTTDAANRTFLGGQLMMGLFTLLQQVQQSGNQIYAALYELNDPELIGWLKAIGGKCNLLLGSGAYKSGEADENAAARKELRLNSSVNIHDRLVKSPHFAHNKFVIFCDPQGQPESLWTGSTNWTVTGLCTQVNNGVLIRSPALAAAYRQRWEDLKDAGATYPAGLATAASTHATVKVGGVAVTAWNAPVDNFVDLDDARVLIDAAKESVLFLMFNPGPQETLLNAILELDPQRLFIHGIVNQDPGGGKKPLIKMTHQGQQLPPAAIDTILPASLTEKSGWFDKEFQYNRVMIHSKVVVIDPFGEDPVVMTGSHNLGPKASSKNDDNLVIIKGAKGLAEEYAVNIMGVYGHYKWLYDQAQRKGQPHFDGNEADDRWQQRFASGPALREVAFWLS
ncbi:MAG TPA: phospholipase D-like domain-containing protein [Stellaceae bacterium]|nr:phospholipase D-like domain-containing protein [Stellaceae bacterium]